jgi:alpha-beta hydrolase superfamily lysophospholipase
MARSLTLTVSTLLAMGLSFMPLGAAFGAESTMPAPYIENLNPELAAKYVYTEDGEYSKAINMPTYEWMPADGHLKAMVVAVHGLTLHGRRFRVLARSLAVNGIGFVSVDMRGFGRCKWDDKHQFSTKDDDKTKVDHEKSYEEIVELVKLVKQKHPDLRLIGMGESLGCTFCVKLAGEHPDLVQGIVLSAPAVRINADMFAGKGQIEDGLVALVTPHHELKMEGFFTDLVSRRKTVQDEMMNDPFIVKELPLGALISTDKFVDQTAKWGKNTDQKLAVLILQGSKDGCVSPKHVTDLMNNMPSDDQTLAWRGNYGHLQLETVYMRAETIDAIAGWLSNHGIEGERKMRGLEQNIADLGGDLTQ